MLGQRVRCCVYEMSNQYRHFWKDTIQTFYDWVDIHLLKSSTPFATYLHYTSVDEVPREKCFHK